MKVFDKVDFNEWQEIADKCEYATFFHTPAWSKIFAETYPKMGITTKKIVFDNGNKIILPLIKKKVVKGLFNSYVSNIAGVYGGIIAEKEIEANDVNKIFTGLIRRKTASITIVGNPFFNLNLPKQFKIKEDFTQVIKLDKDEEEIWRNYNYSCRKQINKARRAGLICREANDFSEWKEYYSIYQEALKRWGDKATSSYPLSLFENIFKYKNFYPENIKLWLVILDKKIVGGNLNFYHNKHCVEWHASFLSEYFKFGIRNFLVHNLIIDAKSRGYRYYDFNPSGGHMGTVRFKETFGPKVIGVNIYEWRNWLVDSIIKVKRVLYVNKRYV